MRERIYEQKQCVDVGSVNELICQDDHLITENWGGEKHTESYVLCYLHQTSTANMVWLQLPSACNYVLPEWWL